MGVGGAEVIFLTMNPNLKVERGGGGAEVIFLTMNPNLK